LPPLRDRREDILPLCQHFLSVLVTENRGPLELSPRAKELLLAYHWPGNVRELKNSIEEAALLSSGGMVYPENLPGDLRRDDVPQPFCRLADVEAQHISRVLQSVNWNKRRAAEVLGINRSTLYEKIRLYGLERPRDGSQPLIQDSPAGAEASGTEEGHPAELLPSGPAESLLAERDACSVSPDTSGVAGSSVAGPGLS
jgi:transcriptional regulator with AAA-type ATPase domain